MRVQVFLYAFYSAYLSEAVTLPRSAERLERRQSDAGDGATPTDAFGTISSILSGMLGGSQSISGLLSGFSIASMYVTAINCKLFVKHSQIIDVLTFKPQFHMARLPFQVVPCPQEWR
jgi:hypothetical protein